MKITPTIIKTQEFTKSLRGYDADEVQAFLEKLAVEVEELINENETLIDENGELKRSLDEYKILRCRSKQDSTRLEFGSKRGTI